LDEKIKAHGSEYKIEQAEWEVASGVGAVVTEEMIAAAVDTLFSEHATQIKELGHDFQFSIFLNKMKDLYKWADGGLVRTVIQKKKLELLGEEKPATGDEKKKKVKAAPTEKTKAEEKKEEEEPTIDITQLIGRDVDAGNSAELLAQHRAFTGGKVMTRFPPEPNGYLHIGHAKAIRFNFTVAKEYGGLTYLRFDDTNPCKENNEFIDHINEIVGWLGYKPWKTTASSDYFD